MGDWGTKVSQKGYDVKTCADNELLFSSSFRTLQLTQSGLITAPADALGTSFHAVSHGLGYLPAYMSFRKGADGEYRSDDLAYIDDTFIYFNELPSETDYYYYIFNHDITETVNQLNILTTPTSVDSKDNYGLKISKSGNDIKTSSEVNEVIDSSSRSFIIHKAGSKDINAATGSVTHDLGYIPMYLAYYINALGHVTACNGFNSYSTTTELKFDFNGGVISTVYYIIFKDPIV